MVIFSAIKKSIIGKIENGESAFSEILTIFKKFECRYNPASSAWIVPKSSYEPLIEALEDITILSIENQVEIDTLLCPESEIEFYRPYSAKYSPKLPHIPGKHPFEQYQLDDIKTLTSHNRYGAFLDMGLGKSYICLSAYHIYRTAGKVKKLLLITSYSGVSNLYKEVLRFTDVPAHKIAIGGTDNRRSFDNLDIEVVICSYGSFTLVSDDYQKDNKHGSPNNYQKCPIPFTAWLQGEDGMILCDESHMLANPDSQQSRVVLLASPFFEYRYLSSGTPADVEQKWYAQLKFLDPALVKGRAYGDWCKEYFDIGNARSKYALGPLKVEMKRELAKIVASVSIRRFTEDTIELPENYIKKIYVPFSKAHGTLYRTFVFEELKKIEESNSFESEVVFNRFPYIINAVDNPLLLKKNALNYSPEFQELLDRFNFHKNHSKIEILKKIIEEHPNEKIVIWTSHPSVGDEILTLLGEKKCILINGETAPAKGKKKAEHKVDLVEQFRTSTEKSILIAGIQVLNTSISLVESCVQIYFDTSFSYIEFSQSAKRIHRLGQTRPVTTYILIIDKSLDVTRRKRIEEKRLIDRDFLKNEFLDIAILQKMFTMEGD